jgi:hypothetical protein
LEDADERAAARVRAGARRREDDRMAAIRHRHTSYDELLARGIDRATARQQVARKIEAILEKWRARRSSEPI